MEMQEKFLWGAIIGSAMGAAAALMLTPISGSHMRKKIIDGLSFSGNHKRRSTRGHGRRQVASHKDENEEKDHKKLPPSKVVKKAKFASKSTKE